MLNNIDIINKASETRNNLGIGSYESVNIFKVLKDMENISVIITEIGEKISGFFIKKKELGLVVINSSKSLGHQHFTAAHEYYHIKYDTNMTSAVCTIQNFNESPIEKKANEFAAMFLVPDDALRYMAEKRIKNNEITLDDVIFLENYFGVSHRVMLIRLKAINLITDREASSYSKGIIKNAKQLGYEIDLYKNTVDKGTQVLSEYAEIAKTLLDSQKITYGKYEELLLDAGLIDIIYGDDNDGEIQNELEDADSF
ncbi:ImmA/IrrE family metallo-endopeptidase [Clostridium sp. AWRP]|uniref:ImmA/IrrE family metallo-endopeptidase n=1 Tax=Clostridium sp. AWRP TaxID=2212991 RepID=UPI000FD6D8EA|nr:ImmA/IrrE family metallo-endopeptidase [Clostridium sp. AWRP]AZV56033.1 ImmA/IrrE family metallo-endopeptidase [Clostridium sp. AWRP]